MGKRDQLQPGLYASEDGKKVAYLSYVWESPLSFQRTKGRWWCDYYRVLPHIRGGYQEMSLDEFARKYPLRVVRCEVEQ